MERHACRRGPGADWACVTYDGRYISCSRFSPDIASKRGLSTAEMTAVEAIHRAVEFNPHVPKVGHSSTLTAQKQVIVQPSHPKNRSQFNPFIPKVLYSRLLNRGWKDHSLLRLQPIAVFLIYRKKKSYKTRQLNITKKESFTVEFTELFCTAQSTPAS